MNVHYNNYMLDTERPDDIKKIIAITIVNDTEAETQRVAALFPKWTRPRISRCNIYHTGGTWTHSWDVNFRGYEENRTTHGINESAIKRIDRVHKIIDAH